MPRRRLPPAVPILSAFFSPLPMQLTRERSPPNPSWRTRDERAISVTVPSATEIPAPSRLPTSCGRPQRPQGLEVARVGLVVVSHSSLIAEGLVQLAGQMAPSVAIRAAGGTDDGRIGTSFERI